MRHYKIGDTIVVLNNEAAITDYSYITEGQTGIRAVITGLPYGNCEVHNEPRYNYDVFNRKGDVIQHNYWVCEAAMKIMYPTTIKP